MKTLTQEDVEKVAGGDFQPPPGMGGPLPPGGNIRPEDWGNPIFWANGRYIGPIY